MGFEVRQETLVDARDEAIAALGANREHPIAPERFDWLYVSNPDGEAVLWTIRKQETGELAGFTVALPRRVAVDGIVRRSWNTADFSIYPRFRTLGIAMKLRRAAKEGVDAGEADFLYGHPNHKMELIHEKVGHARIGTMVRYARLLRSERALERRIGNRPVAKIVSKIADPILNLRGRARGGTNTTKVVADPEFDHRFDALFEDCMSTRRVVGVRDANYLSWRFAANPLYRTSAVMAEQSDRLAGYVLFTVQDNTAHVKDLLGQDDSALIDSLSELIEHCLMLGLESISIVLLDGHPAIDALCRFGFVRRSETSTMCGYAAEENPLRETILDSRHWFGTVGDRDV